MQVKSGARLVIQHDALVRRGVFMPPVAKRRLRALQAAGMTVVYWRRERRANEGYAR